MKSTFSPFPAPAGSGKFLPKAVGSRWSRNGRELFYRSGDKMMAVDVVTQPAFQAATPRVLFQGPYEPANSVSPNYDVSADGQRFLMVQPSEQQPAVTEFNVVLNWFDAVLHACLDFLRGIGCERLSPRRTVFSSEVHQYDLPLRMEISLCAGSSACCWACQNCASRKDLKVAELTRNFAAKKLSEQPMRICCM